MKSLSKDRKDGMLRKIKGSLQTVPLIYSSLGDDYVAWYRGKKEAPGTYGDIMNNNGRVTDIDIELLWKAWITNQPQFFPKK